MSLHSDTPDDALPDFLTSYDETRLLYIGLFSRTPNNIFNANYTELNDELLERFFSADPYSEGTFETLFALQSASQEGIKEAAGTLTHESYADFFKRFYSDERPQYRCFVAILALCGTLDVNITERQAETDAEFERMSAFMLEAQALLQSEAQIFRRYFVLATAVWMDAVSPADVEATIIQRDMSSFSRRVIFNNLFAKLNRQADLDASVKEWRSRKTSAALALPGGQ